jgi:hypothetical protein
MRKLSFVLTLVVLAALALVPRGASAQYNAGNPYAYWSGLLTATSGYVGDYVPYFVRYPPVYYGYSMLLPQGDGFTTRSYSTNPEFVSEPRPPLIVTNPYLAPESARTISLRPVAHAARIKNPFLLP